MWSENDVLFLSGVFRLRFWRQLWWVLNRTSSDILFFTLVNLKLNPLKAEQLCKASQYEEAIEVFQTALAKGTSDPDLRAAVFSQIGNAYFYLRVSQSRNYNNEL